MQTTITKAVIAAVASFGTLVQAAQPATLAQWLQVVAEAIASGAIVWYVPNTPKSGGGTT